jgi:LysM repeat protein
VMNGLAYPTDDFVFRTYVKPDFQTYVIVAGDTLSTIAERFGVTVDQILAANPSIADPNRIAVGQVINIPVSSIGTAIRIEGPAHRHV